MKPPRLLLVENDADWLEISRRCLMESGEYEIFGTRNLSEGLSLLERDVFDVVIADLNMKGAAGESSGFALLEQSRAINPDIPVIVITGFGTDDLAIRVMSAGAYDYVRKGRIFSVKLVLAVRGALRMPALKQELLGGRPRDDYDFNQNRLIGNSSAMEPLFDNITKALKGNLNILIEGEKGIGKGLVAQAIHRLSERSTKPYFVINCANPSTQTLKSELLGSSEMLHLGVERQLSKFAHAKGGTVYLDNIASLNGQLQEQLLNIVRERAVLSIEEEKRVQLDMRLIASSDVNLEKIVEVGRFRQDLFDTLAQFIIVVPPLRDRKDVEDIPTLAAWFLQRHRKDLLVSLSHEALEILLRYNYPGNVAELESAVKYALAAAPGEIILPKHLPVELRKYKSFDASKSSRERSPGPEAAGKLADQARAPTEFAGPNQVITIYGDVGSLRGSGKVNKKQGLSGAEINRLFKDIFDAIEKPSEVKRANEEELRQLVREILTETQRGKDADPSKIELLLKQLKSMASDIFDVAVACWSNPVAGIGLVLKKISAKVQAEADEH